MGVTNVLYNYGFDYENPKKPYQMEGFVNSPDAVKGLEFYKALYKCCTAPGMTNAYMQEGLDAFKSGQVAMQMNWFAFFPGLYKDPECRRRQDRLLRQSRRTKATSPSLAARAFRWSPTPSTRKMRCLHQVVRPARGATEVVGNRRLLGSKGGRR